MAGRSFVLIAQGAGLNALHQCVLVIGGECGGTGHSPQCPNGGGAKTSGRVSDPYVVTRRTVVYTPNKARAIGGMRERQVEKSEDSKRDLYAVGIDPRGQ